MSPFTNWLSRIKWWQSTLLIILATILYIHGAGLIGTKILVPKIGWDNGGILPADEFADTVEGRFARWDTGYYLMISEFGYRPDGCECAFFPLYPLLIRFVSKALGISSLWGGLLVSVSCFIGSGLFLYKWVLLEGDSKQALWSVVWLCIFPMSFFFVSLYTESLFLLLSIAAIYFSRRGKFISAGLAIAFAGATRPTAFLLAIPYILEFILQNNFHLRRCLRFIIGGLFAPLGLFSYLIYLSHQRSSLNVIDIYFVNQSAEWNRTLTWPWITFYDGIRAAFMGVNIQPDWFSRLLVWQDLVYALFTLSVAIWALSYFRLSISAYLVTNVLFLISNHGPYGYAFYSIPRYIAVLFPLYPIFSLLSLIIPTRYRWLIIVLPIILLGLLSTWFATGRWVA